MVTNDASVNDFRIIFMGTPEFAVASLKGLLEAGFNVIAVVTVPDKPQGRGQLIRESEVKTFAGTRNLPVLSPSKLKDESFIRELQSMHADVFVVVAFRMLPEVVWRMPPYGTINLHASLLPQYRGAAPINWAIINGETKTGVTTFIIEKEIDTGKIILSREVDISPEDNAGSLHDKLMVLGSELLVNTLTGVRNHNISVMDQSHQPDDAPLKTAPKILKENCRINWNDNIGHIHNFIRGLSPYPTAWTVLSQENNLQELTLKIFDSQKIVTDHDLPPGSILTDDKTFVRIAGRGGYLQLLNVQVEGRKRLHIDEFLRGFKNLKSFYIDSNL